MWVSRAQWDALVKRVYDLEVAHRDSRYDKNFTVYPNSPVPADPWPKDSHLMQWSMAPYYGPSQDISVKAVVEHLLRHTGLKLRYSEGQPAGVKIEAPEQKDAAASTTTNRK